MRARIKRRFRRSSALTLMVTTHWPSSYDVVLLARPDHRLRRELLLVPIDTNHDAFAQLSTARLAFCRNASRTPCPSSIDSQQFVERLARASTVEPDATRGAAAPRPSRQGTRIQRRDSGRVLLERCLGENPAAIGGCAVEVSGNPHTLRLDAIQLDQSDGLHVDAPNRP
jgi:hypothetical protein